MSITTNLELTTALECAESGNTTTIQINANLVATNSFTVQNTEQLLITSSFPSYKKITVRTQRIFRILNSNVTISSILFVGSSFFGGFFVSDSNVSMVNCELYPENTLVSSVIVGGGFEVSNHSSLVLINSSISNWKVGYGGAVSLEASNLYLYNTNLSQNEATEAGGALFINSNCTVIIEQFTRISRNVATTFGGGIYSEGMNIISLMDAYLLNNSAGEDGGGAYLINSNLIKGRLLLQNVLIDGNSGLRSYSGGVYLSGITALIHNVICSNNFAGLAGACIAIFRDSFVTATQLTASNNILDDGIPTSTGGAIFLSTGGEFICSNCEFYSNFAGEGGVVSNLGGDISFFQSIFSSNTAGDGGVLYSRNTFNHQNSFINCLFQDNSGDTNGGVFYLERSSLHVNNSHFERNILTSTTDNRGGILSSTNSTCLFSNVTIIESHAAVGGAFLCTQESKFSILNSLISKVYSTNNGGVMRTEYNSQIWFTNVIIRDCNAEGNGGIINIQASTTVTILSCTFLNSYSDGIGGIIYLLTNSKVILNNTILDSGKSSNSGGCIGANSGNVTIHGGSISRCHSTSGGAIYLQSSRLQAENTLFIENSGDQGGTILGDADTEITLNHVKFLNNSARYKGGAILLTGGLLVAKDCLFNNSKSQYGGAIHASVGTRLVLLSSILTYNYAMYDGGAIVLQSGDNSYFNGTIFGYNLANTGAVMFLTNSQADFWKCKFLSNVAYESAGVIAFYQQSSVTIKDSYFEKNRGYLGGVFFVDFSVLEIDSSRFVSNYADSAVILTLEQEYLLDTNTAANGYGGIFYSFLGEIILLNSILISNIGYAGGVVWAQLTTIQSKSNQYISNEGYNGGVYAVSEHNVITSSNDYFYYNIAKKEGSLVFGANFGTIHFFLNQFHGHNLSEITASFALSDGTVTLQNCYLNGTGYLFMSRINLTVDSCVVSNISTITGGAIQILTQSVTKIRNTTFISNIGEYSGGAITYKNTYANIVLECSFISNMASVGGAIEAVSSNVNISNSIFRYNTAKQAGGGIFWTECVLILTNNTFEGNTATYGPDYAASPKSLVITNPNDFNTLQNSGYELTTGITIIAIDYYNQHVQLSEYLDTFPRSSIIVAQTRDSFSSISGLTIQNLDILKGYTTFSNLTVTLTPSSNVTLEFSIQGSSRIESAYLTIYFRSCMPGEIQTSISTTQTICSTCKEGYYSFDPEDTSCIACPSHAECPGGNVIDVNPGYWRQCQTCHEIKQCKTSHACLGGTNTSTQCSDGYEGPLCDVCSDGYFRSGRETCVSCGAGTSYIEIIFAVFLLFVVIFVFMFWKKKEWIKEKFENFAEKVDEALEKYELKAYLTKLKILVGFLQILVNIPEVLAVVFPKSFSGLLDSLNLINLNFFKVFATQCYVNENFYTDLLLATLFPPCLVVLIDTFLRIKYQIALRLNETQPFYSHKQKNMDRRIIFLIIAFCVFSPVSITIFQTFVCEKFEDGVSYLVVDYSVECYTDTHRLYIIYAAFMILLYPIGIPVYYIYHLARKQELINPPTLLVVRKEEKNIVNALVIQEKKIQLRSENESIKDISFLYDSYLPKCWYFEIIECFRRIALTALPVLFLRSTIIQVVLVLIISLGFSALYMELRPFVKNSDNAVAILSSWTLSLTFLGTLCLKVNISEDTNTINTNLYLGIILSLMNGFTLLLTFYLVIVINDEEDLSKDPKLQNNDISGNNNTHNNGANIKLQDLNYEYDSDDDSEVTPEGIKKYPRVELEKTNNPSKIGVGGGGGGGGGGNQEIRSLKEYQRRASLKQQILEQHEEIKKEENSHEGTVATTSAPTSGQQQQQQQQSRRGSVRRGSTGPNVRKQSIHQQEKSLSNERIGPHRGSEVEDFEIYRYSRSITANSDDSSVSNPINKQSTLPSTISMPTTQQQHHHQQQQLDNSPKQSFLGYFFSNNPNDGTNSNTTPVTTAANINPILNHETTVDSDDEV